jgi:BlaI family penicillinase repressor
MSPREMREILETEWDLLDALWTAGRGTAREITEALADRRGWAYSTVKTMLDRMVDKGLVKGRQVGTVWEYTPAVPRRKAQLWAWRRFVDVAFGGAVSPALGFATMEARLSKQEREELRALLVAADERADRDGEDDGE